VKDLVKHLYVQKLIYQFQVFIGKNVVLVHYVVLLPPIR